MDWNDRMPGEYPVSSQMFDVGVFGCPFFLNTPKRAPKPRRHAWLDPLIYEAPIRFDQIGNEYQFGTEVVRMIQKELGEATKPVKPWKSELGVVRLPGLTDVIARPRLDINSLKQKVKRVISLQSAISFDGFVPLEDSEGGAVQWLVETATTRHPIQSIASNYISGGIICLEDYSCTAFWADHYADPDQAAGRIVCHAQRSLPLTTAAAVSPFQMQAAIALHDGRLLFTDDALRSLQVFKEHQYENPTWGPTPFTLLATHDSFLTLLDLRCKESSGGSIECEANVRINLLSSTSSGGLLSAASDDRISIFDMRTLPRPALEINRNLFGIRQFSWIDWLGEDDLCLYSTDKHASFISLASNIKCGRPAVDLLPLEGESRGLFCSPAHDTEPARLYCLFKDLKVQAWTANELSSLESLGEAPILVNDVAPLVDYPDLHNYISGICTAAYAMESSVWPIDIEPPIPAPPLPLSSAALHLAQSWPKVEYS